MPDTDLLNTLNRIARALERLSPPPLTTPNWDAANAFIWSPAHGGLKPLDTVKALPLESLKGIDHQKTILLQNTKQFAQGHSANNALLWGARGTGKSSIVKAIWRAINEDKPNSLALIEVHREDLESLPDLQNLIKEAPRPVIIYCDDLSFDGNDNTYKSLKSVLEGGLESSPNHVLFYATSNRRHLMPRDMIENERSTAINPAEAVEEKVSLSDRFGLWLGFYNMDQDTYFAAIADYIQRYQLPISEEAWKAEAIEWTVTRGARSGRVAWQYIQDLTGRLGRPLQD